VVDVDPEFERAEDAILALLSQRRTAMSAVDVIDRVKGPEIPEYFVRFALWHLINRGQINLSMDHKVRLVKSEIQSINHDARRTVAV
jgi:hypothetical protein